MLLIIFIALWAFSLFYGISLIRTDRRKLGIRYLIIFSVPLGIFTIAFWLIDYCYKVYLEKFMVGTARFELATT